MYSYRVCDNTMAALRRIAIASAKRVTRIVNAEYTLCAALNTTRFAKDTVMVTHGTPRPTNGARLLRSQLVNDRVYLVLCRYGTTLNAYATWRMDASGNCFAGRFHYSERSALEAFRVRLRNTR